ncbi:MAG: signal peptidase II [Caldilineaceae bacterium]|nr:signal peptidase II [Caldilineaceae bacterium]
MAQKLSMGSLAQRLWIVLVTAGVVIGLDRWTKELIRAAMPLYSSTTPIPALEGYLSFQHVNNYGAAFGIFQGGRIFFTLIAFAVSAGILYYAVRHLPVNEHFVRLLLGLEMGGAIGNVIDRLEQGFVTDFIVTGIPGVYYIPNWNVADSAVVGGVIGLAIVILWQDIQAARREKAAQATATPVESAEV